LCDQHALHWFQAARGQAEASRRELILASRSPQRRAILEQLGIPFSVAEPAYEEVDPPAAQPQELVITHAVGKASSVEGDLVLGVDTTVALDGDSLAKPADAEHAAAMLRRLSGRTHSVYSGLCLRVEGTDHVRLAATEVSFRELSEADIAWYVAREEWRERAGGYAVQGAGAALVTAIAGDYTNVVGLPVAALLDAVAEAAQTVGC
jgi:septum formation protein